MGEKDNGGEEIEQEMRKREGKRVEVKKGEGWAREGGERGG